MRLHEGNIIVPYAELVQAGVSENTLKSAIQRNKYGITDNYKHLKIKKTVQFFYDALPTNIQMVVKEKLTNGIDPHEYIKPAIIEQYITEDDADNLFLNTFLTPSGTFLPPDTLIIYKRAAAILNTLSSFRQKKFKSELKTPEFYQQIINLIVKEKLNLPTNYSRLQGKVREYEASGTIAVVHKNYGNDNSRKIGETEETIIRKLMKDPRQLSAEAVSMFYNTKALEHGLPPVCTATVKNYARKYEREIAARRGGSSIWRQDFDYIVGRERPSRPCMLWVGDGTPYELYYQEQRIIKGKKTQHYWNRLVAYMVIDAYNDTIVGIALGDQENSGLIRLAWKNASCSTGYLPDQIQVDNFGLDFKKENDLSMFFKSVCKTADYFTPAAPKNARSKVIEQHFAKMYNAVTRYAHNAAGRNITSKEQPNREHLEAIKHTFPTRQQCEEQILTHVAVWNNMTMKRQISRQDEWNQGDFSQARRLDDQARLMLFGTPHKYLNTLTNNGLIFTLNSIERKYMLFEQSFYQTIGTQYQIIYDPADFSKILVTAEGGRVRYMLNEEKPIPMAFGDMKEGDRKRLNQALSFRKEIYQEWVENADQRDDKILQAAGITNLLDAEAYMKVGMGKHMLKEASDALKSGNTEYDLENEIKTLLKK